MVKADGRTMARIVGIGSPSFPEFRGQSDKIVCVCFTQE